MSLDETYQHLGQFSRQLRRFNEALRASHREAGERHADIEGLWRDEAARAYQRAFGDFDARLSDYLNHQAPTFEHFIDQRLHWLGDYLRGGGG